MYNQGLCLPGWYTADMSLVCCCRASAAATRCQTQLETLVEKDTDGLKERIAAAEAAVAEAEQSAAEAVRLQNEIVQAASTAEGHSDVAASHSHLAEKVHSQCCTSLLASTTLYSFCVCEPDVSARGGMAG